MSDTEWCIVCAEVHTSSLVRAHERAAKEYERKYGVSI
jgi:hypothetical protein